MPSIVIFYATGSKQLRGVLVPDNDEELVRIGPYAPIGETMLIVPMWPNAGKTLADPANNQYVLDCIKQATGIVPPDPACAVVDENGVVENIIAADEAIDTLANKTLVQKYHPEIAVGCIFDAKTRQFTVPAQDIQAKLDKQGQIVAAQRVPAKTLIREVKVDGVILQG